MAGDIEQNPGPPNCPCGKKVKGKDRINCAQCSVTWHYECVGLTGLTEGAALKLLSWKCVLCMSLPPKVQQELAKKLKNEETGDESEEESEIDLRKLYNEIKNVRSGVEEINTKISQKEDKVSSPKEPLYNQIVNKELGANINKIVKQINKIEKMLMLGN